MKGLHVFFFFVVSTIAGADSVGVAGKTTSVAPLFVNSGQSLGGASTLAVAAADLDGDNDLDVFAANNSANRVWINNGSGEFSDNGQTLGTSNSQGVALADFDGDDDIDAIVANAAQPDQLWLNDGNGTYSAGQTFPNISSRGVAVADLNGDDEPDIYFAGEAADHIYWNDGAGAFTDSGQSLDAGFSNAVALADLDGDGDVDAFIANGSGNGLPDTVWVNQGGDQGGIEGNFLDSGQQLGMIWTYDVALGELDDAPGPDAFTASWFPPANKVWFNLDAGSFGDSGQNLGNEGSLGVTLGDIDGDTDVDAVVGNNTPDGVKLWINDGIGVFADSGQSVAADHTIYGSVLGDLNNDGAPDLFLAAFGPNQVWFNSTPEPTLPTVGFQPQIVDSRARAGESSAITLDRDGHPHIAYTRYQPHRDGVNYGIWYTRWDGVRWHRELIQLVENIQTLDPYAVAIELDSAGNPDVGIATSDTIEFARRQDNSWALQTIASGDSYRSRVSMALDAQDNPHIVYYNSSDKILYYRYLSGQSWTSEIIDPDADDNLYHDIAVDVSGNPHVSYYSWDDRTLRYAHKVGVNWQSDIVESDPSPQDFAFTSIAIDPSGNPGIAYYWNEKRDLKFANLNGSSWTIETVRTVPASFNLQDRNDLSFDSAGYPHIIYAPDNQVYAQLAHIFWDGAQWVPRVIENSSFFGARASMALDADDEVHVSYYDATYEDLRYAAWGAEYETVAVDVTAAADTTTLGIRERTPSIGFYDRNSGLVEVAEWSAEWLSDELSFSSDPVLKVSSFSRSSDHHFSHYDADSSRLLYSRWGGTIERSVVVDDSADVGRFNDIAFVGEDTSQIRIAYWDATNLRIKMAELNGSAAPLIHVNDQAPALNSASGFVSITALPELNVGISYYDGVNGDLRYAAWDSGTSAWTDLRVDGEAAELGRISDIQVDSAEGVPVMAYYDETADQIKLAYGAGAGFSYSVAAYRVVDVTSLSLSLNMNSRRQARILYSTPDGNLYLTTLNNGSWQVVNLASVSGSTLTGTSMVLEDRLRFSYADSLNGLRYGFRAPNLEFAELPGEQPTLGDGFYNPMDGCIAVLQLFLGDDEDKSVAAGVTNFKNKLPTLQGLTSPLTDQEVFSGMASIFSFTPGGRFYINLYLSHGAEMSQVALDEPGLIWDSYGTLQNFMTGLEAFVTGNGNELLIDQAMVDNALDVWTRVAAAGSPALAGDINTELAKYNNLQDFVGMSFDQWAQTIGVSTPAGIDLVFRDSFE